jgi:two-component system, cell cycle sensor histidine kinase and response regulator CckA
MSAARILIVEDECITAMSLQCELRALGYEVLPPAASGAEALRLTANLQPDLVLMDIQLAGQMDGIEAARQIRHEHATPVIFLTAYSSEDIRQRAAQVRPSGYILKPYEKHELHQVIATALSQHSPSLPMRGKANPLAPLRRGEGGEE